MTDSTEEEYDIPVCERNVEHGSMHRTTKYTGGRRDLFHCIICNPDAEEVTSNSSAVIYVCENCDIPLCWPLTNFFCNECTRVHCEQCIKDIQCPFDDDRMFCDVECQTRFRSRNDNDENRNPIYDHDDFQIT